MTFIDIFLIGVGLSMDAFAVAICKGLCMKRLNRPHLLIIALFFGGFQALMPLIGYYLGSFFAEYIAKYDHWIAFLLLLYIGGKMLYEAIKSDDTDEVCSLVYRLDLKEIAILAVATSIDALAVGITFSFALYANIWVDIGIIGITTFVIVAAGVAVGNKFGTKFKKKAEISGGLILVLIGVKMLLEGVGII